MKRSKRLSFVFSLLVTLTLSVGVPCVTGGEVEDALDVEAVTGAEEAEIEETAAAVEELPVVAAPAASMIVENGREVALLLDALHRKDEELRRARGEIARLQAQMDRAYGDVNRQKRAMYYNLGCVYRAARHYEKAEQAFLKALEMNELDAAVHYNLAVLYDDDMKRTRKARSHYERFLELAPNDKDAPRVIEWLSALID